MISYKVENGHPILYFIRECVITDIEHCFRIQDRNLKYDDQYYKTYNDQDLCVKLEVYEGKLLRAMYGIE